MALSEEFIKITDLYTAYKKAKFEAFFDSAHPCSIKFANYEQDLEEKLRSLQSRITAENWFEDSAFLGSYYYVPKSLKEPEKKSEEVHFCAVDPIEDWKLKYPATSVEKPNAQLRLVISPTVDYQILSALWTIKVGHKYEEKVDKKYSYANSLRRVGKKQEINTECVGLFKPYYGGYQKWRSNGLSAMRDAVSADKKISAVTMDITSFYHQSSAKFLTKSSYLNRHKIKLNDDERRFTDQLVRSFDTWYSETPDFIERPQGALPVGLTASRVNCEDTRL